MTLNPPRIRPSAWLLTACLLSGCILGGESGKRPPIDPVPGMGEYRVSGNLLIMRLPPDTLRHCVSDSLWTTVVGGQTDTLEFSLQGRTLDLYSRPGDSVQLHTLLAREEGSGLEGRWKVEEIKYRLEAGSLSDSLRTWWGQFVAMQNRFLSFMPTEFEFRSGRVTRTAQPPAAGYFLAQWNGDFSMGAGVPDSAMFDVEVLVIDPFTMEMRGRRNGETVRIAFAADGRKSFASDNPARPDYAERDPASCPQDPEPWYSQFLVDNLR